MRKIFGVLATLSLLGGLAGTACASEITWALMGNGGQFFDQIAMKFQKKTGNVVKIQYCQDTRALTDMLMDNPPDLISMNPSQMTEYVEMGIFSDISKLLTDKRFLSDFFPSVMKVYSSGRKIYAIPWNAQITAMRYNSDLFKKSGVKPPTASWRYTSEYYQAMKKFSKDTNGDRQNDQWGLVGYPIGDFMPVIYSFGAKIVSDNGKKFLFTGKEAVQSLDFIKKLHTEGLARVWDWSQGNDDRTKFPFLDGKVATVITSGRMMNDQVKFKLGIIVPPKGPAGNYTSVDASGIGVFNKSKKKKQAVDFIKFLTSSEIQTFMYSKGGIMPTVQSALDSQEMKRSKTDIDPSLLRALPRAKSMSANPALRRSWAFNRGLGQIINGEMSTTDFIQQLKDQVEQAIANGQW